MPILRFVGGLLIVAWVSFSSSEASAQYKNTSFGFDAGFWLVTQPDLPDDYERQVNSRPLRLSLGARLGGETNFKLAEDHWWFSGRVNLALFDWANETEFDQQAGDALGTLMGIQGSIGVRYIFLTDKVRPYMQLSLSYLRLLSFASLSGEDCGNSGEYALCNSGSTYSSSYLPHPNVGGLHLQPGLELIVSRDTALHLFVDIERWIVFGPDDNWGFVFGLGILWFT
ncbi:MAG: hypothetical protein A2289_22155 [Deltaproteobacteria bacterium RIFOXYA12_FULL_58_15]|nr:MAG: hypothetical protein A2289_22155 [Deltaproteobacteria bacterium RIFOXYA12_FULL_58_15]OGR12596.1 MAG: hypothetical protein A2341_23785 [Deltaproteobacteria bacterium RIFOXYB12_FULL_58_9]